MLQLSKRVEYALMALLHLDSLPRGKLASTREISEVHQAPAELQAKVLQSLARAGVVSSVQGARGGYRLERPLDAVTLGEVIEAVDGPLHLVQCQEDPASCKKYCTCNIREPIERIQAQLGGFIHNINLAVFRAEAPGTAALRIERGG